MIRNKSFINFICAISIATVLLVSITGRTVPVKAVGTTAAIAGTAFVLTGAIYLSYVALTQGELVLPAAEELHNWLGGIGRKVSQYSSGASAYQEIYEGLARDPAANLIDGVWTWTQDRLKSFANDFSDTRIIENITGYYQEIDVSNIPTNGFSYLFSFVTPTRIFDGSSFYPLSNYSLTPVGNNYIIFYDTSMGNNAVITPYASNLTIRNVLNSDGRYTLQYLNNGIWQTFTINGTYGYIDANSGNYVRPFVYQNAYEYYINRTAPTLTISGSTTYPLFPFVYIYDSVNDVDLPMVIPNSEVFHAPQWNDPNNNNRPIIPWIPIPQLPANVTPPSNFVNPQWGFNLQDLLDKLEELAGTLIDIGGIAGLINEFAGLHGDEYYIEYNDGDTNYYTYYQPTIFDNDTEYVTYNIDVSEQQDSIPVDLNTIQLYTDNNYLDEIKIRSRKFGETLGEYFVFWHNSDPMTVYVIFGYVIVVLIGAFIGKWGHS